MNISRRDTILIAILVNAGLLLILFATAVKNNKEAGGASSPKPAQQEVKLVQDNPALVPNGSLDQASVEPLKMEVASPSLAAKPDAKFIEITVKPGDFLDRIARANGVSVEDLIRINDLSGTHLTVGQVLKIPVMKSTPSPAISSEKKVKEGNRIEYYTVAPGDTLWSIASKNNIKINDLLKLNNLDDVKARKLRPGDRLRVK